jgi:hypothetical protein
MRIIVNDATGTQHMSMIRAHLQDMQVRFQRGDYSGPAHIHGAELHYRTTDAKLISALRDGITTSPQLREPPDTTKCHAGQCARVHHQ